LTQLEAAETGKREVLRQIINEQECSMEGETMDRLARKTLNCPVGSDGLGEFLLVI